MSCFKDEEEAVSVKVVTIGVDTEAIIVEVLEVVGIEVAEVVDFAEEVEIEVAEVVEIGVAEVVDFVEENVEVVFEDGVCVL